MTRPISQRPSGLVRDVRIWDLPTRLFHWSLVAAVATAGATGFLGDASLLSVHTVAGYSTAGLVIFRLVWGVFGSTYSRFGLMLRMLADLPAHCRSILRLKPLHYVGHNPAGSLMIFGLLLVLMALSASGLILEGGQEKQGLLAGVTPYWAGRLAREPHELLAYALALMVAGHIAGVLFESVLLRVPLIRGMITGWLPVPTTLLPATPLHGPNLWLAVPVLTVVTAGGAYALAPLALMAPLGVPAGPVNQVYTSECGACHEAYHPSLLPRAAWARLIASLDDHFGEDASLTPVKTVEVAAYLDANAAEAWDTEPANVFRQLSGREPMRASRSPFWERRHAHLPDAIFATTDIKSRSHCSACHHDAAAGRFADQQIWIPESAEGAL